MDCSFLCSGRTFDLPREFLPSPSLSTSSSHPYSGQLSGRLQCAHSSSQVGDRACCTTQVAATRILPSLWLLTFSQHPYNGLLSGRTFDLPREFCRAHCSQHPPHTLTVDYSVAAGSVLVPQDVCQAPKLLIS